MSRDSSAGIATALANVALHLTIALGMAPAFGRRILLGALAGELGR